MISKPIHVQIIYVVRGAAYLENYWVDGFPEIWWIGNWTEFTKFVKFIQVSHYTVIRMAILCTKFNPLYYMAHNEMQILWYQELLVVYCIMGIVCGRKSSNFANLEVFANVFLHFLSPPEFLYYKTAWITKVFLRTMAKKVIRETFLPQMIPVIQYILAFSNVLVYVSYNAF